MRNNLTRFSLYLLNFATFYGTKRTELDKIKIDSDKMEAGGYLLDLTCGVSCAKSTGLNTENDLRLAWQAFLHFEDFYFEEDKTVFKEFLADWQSR